MFSYDSPQNHAATESKMGRVTIMLESLSWLWAFLLGGAVGVGAWAVRAEMRLNRLTEIAGSLQRSIDRHDSDMAEFKRILHDLELRLLSQLVRIETKLDYSEAEKRER